MRYTYIYIYIHTYKRELLCFSKVYFLLRFFQIEIFLRERERKREREREREREIFKKKVRNSFKKKIVIEEIKYVLFEKKKGSSVFDYEHET